MKEIPSWIPLWIVGIGLVLGVAICFVMFVWNKTSWLRKNGKMDVLAQENEMLKQHISRLDEMNEKLQHMLEVK